VSFLRSQGSLEIYGSRVSGVVDGSNFTDGAGTVLRLLGGDQHHVVWLDGKEAGCVGGAFALSGSRIRRFMAAPGVTMAVR
jgi:hypothetical protein